MSEQPLSAVRFMAEHGQPTHPKDVLRLFDLLDKSERRVRELEETLQRHRHAFPSQVWGEYFPDGVANPTPADS